MLSVKELEAALVEWTDHWREAQLDLYLDNEREDLARRAYEDRQAELTAQSDDHGSNAEKRKAWVYAENSELRTRWEQAQTAVRGGRLALSVAEMRLRTLRDLKDLYIRFGEPTAEAETVNLERINNDLETASILEADLLAVL